MTQNQIAYWNLQEAKRANQEKEREARRSNIAKEQENVRSNLAKEAETARSNRRSEEISATKAHQDYSLGLVKNAETERHNRASEVLNATDTITKNGSRGATIFGNSAGIGKSGTSKQDLNAGIPLTGSTFSGFTSTGTTIIPNMSEITDQTQRDLEAWNTMRKHYRAWYPAPVAVTTSKPVASGATIGVVKNAGTFIQQNKNNRRNSK